MLQLGQRHFSRINLLSQFFSKLLYLWSKFIEHVMVREYTYGRESFIQISRETDAGEAQLGERLFESLKQQVPIATTIYEAQVYTT